MNIEDIEKEIEQTMKVDIFNIKQLVKKEEPIPQERNFEVIWDFFREKHI